ncbi:hypothetical protein AAEY27_07245 [Kosakonia sp. BYX6]|uniref:Uncharacterized protein n=1 Tax=Kosakonia calanthes TaxID=3139408 RepID=A0ABZ3BDV2_9ENTR
MTEPWRLINVDSFIEGLPAEKRDAQIADLAIASLAFRNFDCFPRRKPFILDCVTDDPLLWEKLCDAANRRYWVKATRESLLLFDATPLCGCLRTYRIRQPSLTDSPRQGWTQVASEAVLYNMLDTPANRAVWQYWTEATARQTAHATGLAEGRMSNTGVQRSLIFSGENGCIACNQAATAYANTTVAVNPQQATLIQIPVCPHHFALAQASPNVMTFFAGLFSLELDLPETRGWSAIPDEFIPEIHDYLAGLLNGTAGVREKRRRGWHLEIALNAQWCWKLRLKSLTDYSYMLFKHGERKAAWRGDSANDHPELPYPPHHEHSRPDRKGDKRSASFLYGFPLFDVQRLRDISEEKLRGDAGPTDTEPGL